MSTNNGPSEGDRRSVNDADEMLKMEPCTAIVRRYPMGIVDVDPERMVPVCRCPSEDLTCLPRWSPGAIRALAKEGKIIGYHFGCPGCGHVLFLGLSADPGQGWTCLSPRPADLGCLTLSPDIVHAKDRGGCGWKGRILRGNAYPI